MDGEQVTKADIAFHAATAHVYDDTLEPVFRAHTALVSEPILDSLRGMAPGMEALDIGCGTGAVTVRLAQSGFRVRGVDHSTEMLDLAELKLRSRGMEADLRQGDVRALPFDDASFDVVTCTGVLHHLPSIGQAVREAERVLRPSGVLWISEPCVGSNPALRAWEAVGRASRPVRIRLGHGAGGKSVQHQSTQGAPLDVPDHQEGPIDAGELMALLDERRLIYDASYWSFFEGLHRAGPLWVQKAVVRAGSRPWRRRGGNLIVVLARKEAAGAANSKVRS